MSTPLITTETNTYVYDVSVKMVKNKIRRLPVVKDKTLSGIVTITDIIKYFHEKNKEDSAVYYAKKAIASVETSAFTNYSVKPAKLLIDIYENNNSDSAVKYFKIYETISDSVYSTMPAAAPVVCGSTPW